MTQRQMPTIGVLALQGDFAEHVNAIQSLGYPAQEVRTIEDAKQTSGLIIPGGESTAIGKLLLFSGLRQWIVREAAKGYPVYGTCAGCILIAKQVDSPYSLGLIDITAKRNAYGRQLDSFETILSSQQFKPFRGIFIRAPKISVVGKNVKVLLKYKSEPVLVQSGNILAGTFHPELSESSAIHAYFIQLITTGNE